MRPIVFTLRRVKSRATLVIFTLCLSTSPLFADPGYVNTFYDSKICNSIQESVDDLPLNISSTDWPKAVHADGLEWPNWTKVSPIVGMRVIEEMYIARRTGQFVVEAQKDARFSQQNQAAENIWKSITEPFYIDAIKQGNLVIESTTINDTAYKGYNAVAFRFRIDPRKTIPISANPQFNTIDNWQYIIRIQYAGDNFADYPVLMGSTPLVGELGIIDKKLAVFNTLFLPRTELDEVMIASDQNNFAHISVTVASACPIVLP